MANIYYALTMCWALSQMLYMDSYLILTTTLSALETPSTAPGPVGLNGSFSPFMLHDFSLLVGSNISPVLATLGSLRLHRVSELFPLLRACKRLEKS